MGNISSYSRFILLISSTNPTTMKFFPSPSSILQLRNAAASQGLSRYHLLAPILVESLALQTAAMTSASKNVGKLRAVLVYKL